MQAPANERPLPIERSFEEIADRTEIAALLGQVATWGAPVFAAETGTKDTFLTRIERVEADRDCLRVVEVTGPREHGPYRAGMRFELYAAAGDADFFFEAALLGGGGDGDGFYCLGMPDLVCRIKRRVEPRGRSFASWSLRLRRKASSEQPDVRARLRDISCEGVGLLLQSEGSREIEVGAVFDDCLLFVREMPIATCVLEIVHVTQDAEGGRTIAGGRFVGLDALARSRIEKLVAAARSEDSRGS